jgi:hypothetical protein
MACRAEMTVIRRRRIRTNPHSPRKPDPLRVRLLAAHPPSRSYGMASRAASGSSKVKVKVRIKSRDCSLS